MKPKRIQLRRTKGWRKPPNTVVVSRPTHWGNPFVAGPCRDGTRHEVVEQFRTMLTVTPNFVARIQRELRGKNLACWCPIGEPCHADVLLELANREQPNDPSSPTGTAKGQ